MRNTNSNVDSFRRGRPSKKWLEQFRADKIRFNMKVLKLNLTKATEWADRSVQVLREK